MMMVVNSCIMNLENVKMGTGQVLRTARGGKGRGVAGFKFSRAVTMKITIGTKKRCNMSCKV